MKGTLDLCCAARRGGEERSNPKRGGKLTSYLGFAEVYPCERTSSLLLHCFIVSLDTMLVGQVRSSGPARRVSKAKGGQREIIRVQFLAGFNSAAWEASRVQSPARKPRLDSHLTLLLPPRGYRSRLRISRS